MDEEYESWVNEEMERLFDLAMDNLKMQTTLGADTATTRLACSEHSRTDGELRSPVPEGATPANMEAVAKNVFLNPAGSADSALNSKTRRGK